MTEVLHLDFGDGEERSEPAKRSRMSHQAHLRPQLLQHPPKHHGARRTYVHLLVRPALDQNDLPSDIFFGRRAEQDDLARRVGLR